MVHGDWGCEDVEEGGKYGSISDVHDDEDGAWCSAEVYGVGRQVVREE